MRSTSTKVQAALRSREESLDTLKASRGITHRRHQQHTNLVLLKYNQIESPFADPIVRECRGIVLDEDDGWRVVARGFDKFFNHGEGQAAPIDWSTAEVQEKVDGSLCVMYAYRGQWHVATTGTPDASGNINGQDLVFSDLFWRTLGEWSASAKVCEERGTCFLFELCSPHNRVVVPYETSSVTLLAIRETSGRFVDVSEGARCFPLAKVVKRYPLGSFEDIVKSFDAISPLSQEGYVVADAHGSRVKVKHPGYVALHHAKDGMTWRAFVEIARTGETSEVVAAFPEFARFVESARDRFVALVGELESDYEKIRGVESQKDFALLAQKSRCSSALFSVRAGKAASVADHLRRIHVDRVIDMIGTEAGAA